MVAEAATFVDVEGAVREWARDEITSVARRVFFGHPDSATHPLVVLSRLGGPDGACLVQFDCWAATKAASAELAAEVATAADALTRFVDDGIILHGAAVEGIRWAPDPDSDLPRHIVDVTFTATAAT